MQYTQRCAQASATMQEDDIRFGRLAIQLGFMNREQVKECLRLRAGQAHKSMADLCMERGYLAAEQLGVMLGHLSRQARSARSVPERPLPAAEPAASTRRQRRSRPQPAPPAAQAPPPLEDPFAEVAQPRSPLVEAESPFESLPPLPGQPREADRGAAAAEDGAREGSLPKQTEPEKPSVRPPGPGGQAAPRQPAPAARGVTLSADNDVASPAAPHPSSPPPEPDRDLVTLLANGRRQGASDVHLVADRAIAFRYLGELHKGTDPMAAQRVERMLRSVMPPHARAQLDRLGYADFAVQLPDAGRFRANVSKQSTGLKGCFRIVSDHVPTLEQLGLPAALGAVGEFHQGLAIVAGPNGMGKTTTLAALVGMINTTRPCHIITIEDPIEIVHPIATSVMSQREVGVTTASFARALKAALREDPDVIVIGELRDEETVEIALEAAETGHLVIATMSTRSGAKTIDRLIDMFPPDKQAPVRATLAGTLKIVVSQRLIHAADGKRMVPAAEVIMGNTQLWNLIKDNKLIQLPSLMQRGKALGMMRFDESLIELTLAGTISEEVALQNADNPAQLKRDLALARAPRPMPAEAQAAARAARQSQAGTALNKFFGKK